MTTIGSLCTGYGGLDMAVQSVVGGRLAWVSDILPASCTVLAAHHPDVPNLGDFTSVDWEEVKVMAAPRNDALAEAMYADYCAGMSIQAVGRKWDRSRQTVHKMFARRGYPMRPTYTGRRDQITYDGRTYTPADVGYYRCTTGDRHYLHRRVYEDIHGIVPPGMDVHHVDHDKANNDPSNLVALAKDAHARLHAAEAVMPGSPTVDVLTAGYP